MVSLAECLLDCATLRAEGRVVTGMETSDPQA